jgi:cystathionine gamma-lyase
MRDSTKFIRSALTLSAPGDPLLSGPVFAAPYHVSDAPYTYALDAAR